MKAFVPCVTSSIEKIEASKRISFDSIFLFLNQLGGTQF